jgi:Spy/CpxP family protein refolding chaperone
MRLFFRAWLPIVAAVLAAHAYAQHQPYSGQQAREIRALSDDEVRQYLSGAGMGYAKSAELNHFPGPMHALELADKLELTAAQRSSVKTLMDAHKAQARAIGAKLIESEKALDQLFRSRAVDDDSLASAVRAAAQLQGEYRLSHLETHRRMRTLLTEAQVERYDALRGYAREGGASGGEHRHQH